MKFSRKWPITTDGSDRKGRMSLPYLCNLLQETATLHADSLGWGYKVLKEQGLQWVLSRQWIQMDRFPLWKEEITVSTWPSGKGGITWNRDFILTDSAGERVGIATSLWFVMDRESRRPRPASIGPDMPIDNTDRVRQKDLKPLPALTDPGSIRKVNAGYHDIDVHDHVNNLRYLTWMTDGIPSDFLDNHEAREVEINFMMEGFIDDELEVSVNGSISGSTEFLQNLRRTSDGAELCRMRSIWKQSR